MIGKIHPENMIIELYSSGELVVINGTIMVIYEIVEWRLEWLSRSGTLLNIAERERGSSRGTDLERKLRITDCNERKMKIANLWVPANLSTFHASLPAS